jgi:16S rRNA processing protein RimM
LNTQAYVRIGKILGAHGVRGRCRAVSYAESAEIFSSDGNFYFQDAQQGMIPFEILAVNAQPRRLLLQIENVDDRKAAQALAGKDIWIKKSDLPTTEEGTYYWFDLIGLTVITTAGAILGKLEKILTTGSNDVYVVRNTEGREILVPALETVVVEVDVEQKQMRVDLPEGL